VIIAHITDSMQVGGAETIIAQLCRIQRVQGHRPCVYCLYEIGRVGQRLQNESFEVTLERPPTLFGLMRSLYRTFKRSKPDVVHCHNATAAIAGAVPARLAGVRSVLVTRHGLVGPPFSLRRELKFAVASRFCDWVVAVCDIARDNLRKAPFSARDRIVRIYNGCVAATADGGAVPAKIGFTLLNVGRLSVAKDQESLIRAFALAKNYVTDLQLWIVGDGPLKSRLKEVTNELGVEKATQFFGEQTDVAPFYVAADLFIMSSVSEGLPVSLLEAMSASLPSIVTDVGGMGEVARLSGSTLVVPASSYKALAEAICEVAQNRFELVHLKSVARRCYEENFTLATMADEYLRLYQSSSDCPDYRVPR
jgi:glycosyltransferase involved in cell wall biosynthesis